METIFPDHHTEITETKIYSTISEMKVPEEKLKVGKWDKVMLYITENFLSETNIKNINDYFSTKNLLNPQVGFLYKQLMPGVGYEKEIPGTSGGTRAVQYLLRQIEDKSEEEIKKALNTITIEDMKRGLENCQ